MMNRIQGLIAHRSDRLKLETMNDRLLADIGVERLDIPRWLRGRAPAVSTAPSPRAATGARPLATRLRSASAAFVRELRADAGREGVATG